MSSSNLFNIDKQFTFYGAYHSNKVNVLIHIICVPIIIWSAQVFTASIPLPSFVPHVQYPLNQYLSFELNVPAVIFTIYLLYYFALEPVAAALYAPQLVLSLLAATAYSRGTGHVSHAVAIHVLAWVAQFLGHGVWEKRAPALLDNLLGAILLAPFFVHLELLFNLGYRPDMHKRIRNEIGKEITKIRKAEGEKNRQNNKSS